MGEGTSGAWWRRVINPTQTDVTVHINMQLNIHFYSLDQLLDTLDN